MRKLLPWVLSLLLVISVWKTSSAPIALAAGCVEDCYFQEACDMAKDPSACRKTCQDTCKANPNAYGFGAYKRGPWFLPTPADYGQGLGLGAAVSQTGGGAGAGGATGGNAAGAINAEKFSSAQMSYVANWLIGQVGGYVAPSGGSSARGYRDGGAIGLFASSIDSMIKTPPATSRDYVAYMGGKLSVPGVSPAYAAVTGGTGYVGLGPVLRLWTAARNVAYLFFAIAFIVTGIMIVLRQKIDQKTVITIQAALPKIIIALILVTFSYAIAGFLIDVMYVLLQLIFTILGAAVNGTPAAGSVTDMQNAVISGKSFFEVIFSMNWLALTSFSNITTLTQDVVNTLIPFPLVNTVVGGAINLLFMLILVIAILWAVFQIWIKLLMAYVQIILGVIGAPLLIMMDALPGQNQFNQWLMRLLGNVVLFPATILLIILAGILASNFGAGGTPPKNAFVAPMVGIGNPALIASLIGIGILLSAPKILETIANSFAKPLPLGNAWTEPIRQNYLSQQAQQISAEREKQAQAAILRRAAPPPPEAPVAPAAPPEYVFNLAAGYNPAMRGVPAQQHIVDAFDQVQGYRRMMDDYNRKLARWQKYEGSLGSKVSGARAGVVGRVAGLPFMDVGKNLPKGS